MENLEQVEEWFEEFYESHSDEMIEPQYEAKQICAVMFLYEKLKPEEKKQRWFFHGEHDVLYIGSDLNIFEDFTEDDVKKAISYGISISSDGDGFEIYASM